MNKNHSIVSGLISLFLISTIPMRVQAADSRNWPKNFGAFLKPSGNCVRMPNLFENVPLHAGQVGTVTREYMEFTKEEVCRAMKFKKAFEANPGRICPGVELSSFAECYSKVLNKMVAKTGLNVPGFTLMHAIAVMHFLKNKTGFRDPNEAAFVVLDLGWVNLEAFDKRVRADAYSRRFPIQIPSIKTEVEELRMEDEEMSSKYVTEMLKSSEKILKKLESEFESDRSSPSQQGKFRVLENRKKLLHFSSRWKYRLNQQHFPGKTSRR